MTLTQEEIQERLKNLTPEQMQELVKQQCVFCKIIAGEIPAYKIYEDDNFLAFLDVNPAQLGHTLVIPKAHISVLPQMPDQLAASIIILVKELAGKVFEATGAEGVNILQNNGQVAGQVVPHIHFHIIPRFADDGISFGWEAKKLSEEQFKAMQEKIVKIMKTPSKPTPAPKPLLDTSENLLEKGSSKEDSPSAFSKAKGKATPKKEKLIRIKSKLP